MFRGHAFALLLCCIFPLVRSMSCLDESGQPVDYWFIMKIHGSLDYAYVDDSYAGTGPLVLTGKSLDCGASCALGATLTQLLNNESVARVSWNDEAPVAAAPWNATSATSGHTKGVVGADSAGGFWLTHSMPKFPLLVGVDSFSWAAGGASITYGQNFLCVSLTPASIEAAAVGLKFIDPNVYGSVVPAGLSSMYPTLTALVAGARTSGAGVQTVYSTPSNHAFTYFSKSGDWGKDIWEDHVQANLKVDMWVESWLRAPVMPTYCTPTYAFDSVNVETMTFITSDGNNAPYKYTQDHTKLGIAVNGTNQQNWLCAGDNNRMTSQWARGGGAVCFRAAATYKSVLSMVLTVQACP